ncbi:MAG: FAD-dependent thymidylate synthase [bacterium]|nr:FAD-dependent thymidylate synthase [bacterium]
MEKKNLELFAPLSPELTFTKEEEAYLKPFFTNLGSSVYAPVLLPPELIGALCSRTSRAADDLRAIFIKEYIAPFINPARDEKDTEETWREKEEYGHALKEFVRFLEKYPVSKIFANPRARSFYIKWLAEYGDDSIAQMAGSHLIFGGISQVAIKHFEDQRIGLAPIEKSTRYVNYSKKMRGSYLYYTDPTLKDMGLEDEYRKAMDGLFETYTNLLPRLQAHLEEKFPDEKKSVVEKKVFDTLRGLLPTSTLSQVAFFGNGQAFEYMISRSGKHPLGEIRWAANRALEELYKVTPSFLRRLMEPEKQDAVKAYEEYLAGKGRRLTPTVEEIWRGAGSISRTPETKVRLLEYDKEGEEKVLTGILYGTPNNHRGWNETLRKIRKMSMEEKRALLNKYLEGRTARWQKVGRAFENAYMRFETTLNIGAWRDIHRHRMLTQIRQNFSCYHGYDTPEEIREVGLQGEYKKAIERAEDVFQKIVTRDENIAQYAVTLAHRVRFMQWENLRQIFWKAELRTMPEGHPDYRHIEQEKFKLVEKIYPLIAERMIVNMGEYDFARRGQEERVQKKVRKLEEI